MGDRLAVVLIALACSCAVAGVGALVLRATRGRSLAWTTSVVAVVAVASVLAGAVGTATAMFSSPHDLGVLLIVCLTAGVAAVAVGVLLGRRLAADVAAVADLVSATDATAAAADASVSGGPAGSVTLPAELRQLGVRLWRARAEAEEAYRQAAAQEAGRRDLVAWISHDLRTPLAGLRAMTEALEDGVVNTDDDPETVLRYHRRMRQEVERLSGMVDDLFELSRLQGPGLRLRHARVPLRDLVADAVATAEPLARAAGVRLTADDAVDALELPVRVDADEVARLLANLLVNAVRHTPEHGAVRVSAGSRDGSAVIDVTDGCGGIPVEDLPRLFEVGFRGTSARTPPRAGPGPGRDLVPGGAGLGLAIARGLVEAHQGSLTVANVGGGCRFTVTLPPAGTMEDDVPAGEPDPQSGVAVGV